MAYWKQDNFARRHPPPLLAFACVLVLLPIASPALAANCTERVHVAASRVEGSGTTEVVLDGKVSVSRCELVVHAAHGVAHMKSGEVVRVVLTGSPATVVQQLEEGGQLDARAARIEYQVADGALVLAGNAHVVHSARGSYDGARLTYHLASGAISGSGGADGLVHLVLEPETAPATPATTVQPANGESRSGEASDNDN